MDRTCTNCGCSASDACTVHGVPCCWLSDDPSHQHYTVCSSCAGIEDTLASPAGRRWLAAVARKVEAEGPTSPGYEPCLSYELDVKMLGVDRPIDEITEELRELWGGSGDRSGDEWMGDGDDEGGEESPAGR